MRYFVTGGTGFIGGRLVRRLLADGHEIVALVRDVEKAAPLERLGVALAQGDVTQRGTLRAPMMGADGVFHCAAWYEVGTDPSRAGAINVEGTRNVLETMQALSIPKGVYTSTLAVNSDTHGRVVDEAYRYDGPHLSVYDETKARAHWEVAVPLMAQGLPLVVVMPGVVYGPGDTSQMGALFAQFMAGRRLLLPSGTGATWAHVDDVVEAHVLAMTQGEPGETYIVAGPRHTWREAFETAARVTGKPLRAVFVPPGLLRGVAGVVGVVEKWLPVPADYAAETLRVAGGTTYYGDNAKARRALGYAPRSLEAGLRDTFVPAP